MSQIVMLSGLGRTGVETALVAVPLGVYALARWLGAQRRRRGVAKPKVLAGRKRFIRGR